MVGVSGSMGLGICRRTLGVCSWRTFAILLLLPILAGCAGAPQVGLQAADATSAREALARLPAAHEAFRQGYYGEAERRYLEIRARLPDAEHAATAAALLGLPGPTSYRRILSGVETNLGLSLLRARRYRQAIPPLQSATVADPSSAVAWANLGVALLHAQRFCQSLDALERARELGRRDPRDHLHRGRAALFCGDRRRARQALERARRLADAEATLSARGTAHEAELLLAETDAAEGDLESARRRLEALLEETPGDPKPRYRLLRVLARLGDDEELALHRARFERSAELMAAVQSALAERPEAVQGLHWVAETYAHLGLDHLAEAHYLQLLARAPDDLEARRALRLLHQRHRSRLGNEAAP